jgi:hypothetical protein
MFYGTRCGVKLRNRDLEGAAVLGELPQAFPQDKVQYSSERSQLQEEVKLVERYVFHRKVSRVELPKLLPMFKAIRDPRALPFRCEGASEGGEAE